MVPVGWSVESTKVRRVALQRGEAPPLDRGAVRLFRVLNVGGEGEGSGTARRGLCWSTDEDGLRLVVFDAREADPASADCLEVLRDGERELWSFGGAAEVALGLAA